MDALPNENADDQPEKDDLRDMMQQQIDHLRGEMSDLTSRLADNAASVKSKAEELYDGASSAVKDQAADMAEVAKAYPLAISTATVAGALIGLLVGISLSRVPAPRRHWY